MAAPAFVFGEITPEGVNKFAEIKWKELQGHISSNEGWTQFHDADGIKVYFRVQGVSKLFPYCPISCYKLEGLVNGTPTQCADYQYGLILPGLARQDPNIKVFDIIANGPNYKIGKQNNSLPWPIWERQTIFTMYKRTESDGSIWIYSWSVRGTDKASTVDTSNFVEAQLHLGAWGFVPDKASGKTKMIRLLHVDPSGNIPAWVVEANVGNLPLSIKDVRNNVK